MLEVLILSLVQGITEFLPISSSSHLILMSNYINFENKSLFLDVSLHVGSFLAVLTYFYKDVLNFIKNKDLFLKIFFSSIPVMIVGYILTQTEFIKYLRTIEVIGWTTLIFGLLLYLSDKYKSTFEIEKNFTYKSALFIGLFQILSLIPGVSRSGITITAARILKFKRFDAGKISFLLSIPTLGAVSIFGIFNTTHNLQSGYILFNILSVILSFIFSYLTIKFFLDYIRKFSLNVFVVYRVILGLIIIIISYL